MRERWLFQGWSHGPEDECIKPAGVGTYVALYRHEVVLQVRSSISVVQESRWVAHGVPVAVSAPETVEEGSRIRHRFLQWSEGENPFSPNNIIAPLEPMNLEVLWAKEYLVTVEGPAGVALEGSGWYPEGTALVLRAPAEVELGNESETFRFSSWASVGRHVLPPQDAQGRTLTVTVDAPYTLKASYAKVPEVREYRVTLQGPPGVVLVGSGVYPEGTVLVIGAPDLVDLGKEGERLKFVSWESAGQAAFVLQEPGSPITTINVNAAYSVKGTYKKQFFVVVTGPSGTLERKWMDEGEELVLAVLPVIEIVPEQHRLVFTGWEGQQGLRSPKISGVANQAVTLSALYERQFMVTVDAPYGASGGGWRRAGSLVTVAVPGSIQSKLIFKKSFQGFAGQPGSLPSIDVVVNEPTVVTALYNDDVDIGILALLLSIPMAVVLVYIANRWVLLLVRRRNEFTGSVGTPAVGLPGGQGAQE